MSALDTVTHAAQSPQVEQPWAELGLREEEYAKIREILGRRPTSAELAMYSVMWSEHCSYKSSKVHLRRFGDLPQETPLGKTLAGIGENAGVIDIAQGWAVTFKVESHNHPSYVEPYQGAATGIGGIVRDIMAMGARPIAVMDPLRFGALDHPDTARVLPGVVAGIGGYGNSLGLPNIGGEIVFDECYQGNPLVNALCVGALRHEDLHLAQASGAGNLVVLFGAKTGGDGIGGVSVLASETFEDGGPANRPAVQVGDPFAEKVLIECCLDLYRAGVVEGIQDLGGAGLSCATSELASAGSGGMEISLDQVPLRDSTLRAEEILMSESQERMMAVVTPQHLDSFMAIADRWDVEATVLGSVTDGDRLTITWQGETIVDVPPRSVAHDGPVYQRPIARPEWLDAVQADTTEHLPRPGVDELGEVLLALLGSPNLADHSWVTDQFDRYVRGNTAQAMPHDAGVVRVDEGSGLGVAISTDGNGRYGRLDPYVGAQSSVLESYRNVATRGALPLAVTDCLNFGSPEDPGVMWQFEQAVLGIYDACRELGLPVTGGNVSFYNQTGEVAIHPTPVVGVLGVLDEVGEAVPTGFAAPGEVVVLLGTTHDELDGSEWTQALHGHLGGRPPRVDIAAEKALAGVLHRAGRGGLVTSAHDLSDGGLGIALAESVLHRGVGASIDLSPVRGEGIDEHAALFSESTGRVLLTLPSEAATASLLGLAAAAGVPMARLGVTDGDRLRIDGVLDLSVEELRRAHRGTLRERFA